jgi:uncharacterized protein (DUF302 family)
MEKGQNGIATVPSKHSVDLTVQRFEEILRDKGIKLFAVLDHSGEAEKAGLRMRPTKLLIFGNPAAGTPIMTAAPSSAIDLPLKVLVWEDSEKRVWLSFNQQAYLADRHSIPTELLRNIGMVETLATSAGE